jgi:hypothetical protein
MSLVALASGSSFCFGPITLTLLHTDTFFIETDRSFITYPLNNVSSISVLSPASSSSHPPFLHDKAICKKNPKIIMLHLLITLFNMIVPR